MLRRRLTSRLLTLPLLSLILATSAEYSVNLFEPLEFFDVSITSEEIVQLVESLQDYLRIDTRQPTPDYDSSTQFVLDFTEAHLPQASAARILTPDEDKPMVAVHWLADPSSCGSSDPLPSILMTGHMDTVATPNSHLWDSDPLAADIIDGNVFARGSQDMKSTSMAYLEATRRLMNDPTFSPARDLHILFTVDEEIGSMLGNEYFVSTEEFLSWNVGFSIDEGGATPEPDKLLFFTGEKTPCWVKFVAEGPGGHGSRLVENTATHRMLELSSRLLQIRNEQERFVKLTGWDEGEVLSLNINGIFSGVMKETAADELRPENVATNVIPKQCTMTVDIRHPPTMPLQQVIDEILDPLTEDLNITYTLEQSYTQNPATSPLAEFPSRLLEVIEELGFEPDLLTMSGATDARFTRRAGVDVIGFTPINDLDCLAHDVNEYLPVEKYVQMILVFERVLRELLSS